MDLITKTANTKIGGKVSNKKNRLLKISTILLAIILFISGFLFFAVYLPGKQLLSQFEVAKNETDKLKQSVNDKDLDQVKINLSNLNQHLTQIESTYSKLKLIGSFPVAKNYYKDGKEALNIAKNGLETGNILITAVEPYKDFLGIKGAATSSADTTEDRIEFLTQSIESLIPHFDIIESKIANIEASINKIDATRYPDTFKDIEVKSKIYQAQDSISQVYQYVKNSKPLLSKVSWLLGKDSPRNYLMIFQNDGELRPSGGFWTAYSTLTVKNGKVTPGTASNIYDLDDKINSRVPAPRLLKSYHINVYYLNLRDSNLSPDFPTDAKIFLDQYTKVVKSKNKFDAVIAIDTEILVDIVRILGKLDTRVGTFTALPDKRCDGCPSIIYDLQWMSGRPRDYIEPNRKDFMNPLMSALLANVMGSEKTKMPSLIQALFENINQKHVMIYFPDDSMQSIGNNANITGKIVDVDQNTDYLHLNDANFASAKTNIFITQKINHDIKIENGVATHKVSVTYTNPASGSNCNLEKGGLCLNASTYRNLFRFYTPVGSKLIKMTGSEIETVQYEELNKQVFEGFYGNRSGLNPQSSLKTSIDYTSGVTVGQSYSLLLQKQPGTKAVEYQITINGKKLPKFDWIADKTIKFSL